MKKTIVSVIVIVALVIGVYLLFKDNSYTKNPLVPVDDSTKVIIDTNTVVVDTTTH